MWGVEGAGNTLNHNTYESVKEITYMYHHYTPNIPTSSGIYKITCVSTQMFYVGSAINLCQRRYDHFKTLRRGIHRNPKMQNAFNKYGEDTFIFEVLELVLIPEMLIVREQCYLDTLKPWGKKGYNIARIAGSTLGRKFTDATLKKMSDAQKGRVSTFKGMKHTPESLEKMSVSHRGQVACNRGVAMSENQREKLRIARANARKTLVVTDPDGNEYTVTGIGRFCKEHGLTRHNLMKVAKGEYKQHKGWTARYPDTE